MKKPLIILFLTLISSNSFPQATLTIEGTVVNNNITGDWSGVNIKRDVPTTFTYRNNSITSVNTSGYLLQAGDEAPGPSNNKLDGEVITGNKFLWNGVNSANVITHGLFAGYNINSVVKYNYLDKVPYGIIFKSGTDAGVNMTFTSGGCAYNICKNGKFAGRVKGINGIKFYNNTFYSGDGSGWYLLLISGNMDRAKPSPSIGTKVFNNIFYSTIQIPMIKIESGCLTNFESDNNVFWCSAGEPTFSIDGVTHTWAQWRAHGYDSHSVIMNPGFINTTDFVPAARLDYGTNLGIEWQTGLSTNATWVAGSSPVTTDQNGTWQVGARLYSLTGACTPPSAPKAGNIIQPTCSFSLGSIVLSGLPATGTWTLIRTPGETATTGTGTSTTITGLSTGTYYYKVINALGCISVSSSKFTIKAQPSAPAAPKVGTITQPTISIATGSVVLSGLPATGSWKLTMTPGGIITSGKGASKTINGLAAGTTYTFTVTNASGCISAASANVVINLQPTSLSVTKSLTDLTSFLKVADTYDNQTDKISIYPNPVSRFLNIEFDSDDSDNYKTVKIINSTGMLIGKEKAVTPIMHLDFSGFEPGIYILELIKSSGKVFIVKIIKKK